MAKKKTPEQSDSWWWVQGKKRKRWIPLYCARDEMRARAILKAILADSGEKKELDALEEFSDFRVQGPEQPGAVDKGGCPKCGSRNRKKVRKGERRFWRCLECRHRWPRKQRSI